MNQDQKSIITGAVFIIIGVFLLMQKLGMIDVEWYEFYPFLLLGVGAILFLKAAIGQTNNAFWATGFTTVGLFFLLRTFDIIEDLWFVDVWPVILIALGLGFIVLYAFRPNEWGLIIPGVFLAFVGILLFLDQMDLNWWYSKYVARNFWPVLLVVIGTAMIVASLTRKPK